MFSPRPDYFLTVHGDSMDRLGLTTGTLVAIKGDTAPKNEVVVVARIDRADPRRKDGNASRPKRSIGRRPGQRLEGGSPPGWGPHQRPPAAVTWPMFLEHGRYPGRSGKVGIRAKPRLRREASGGASRVWSGRYPPRRTQGQPADARTEPEYRGANGPAQQLRGRNPIHRLPLGKE